MVAARRISDLARGGSLVSKGTTEKRERRGAVSRYRAKSRVARVPPKVREIGPLPMEGVFDQRTVVAFTGDGGEMVTTGRKVHEKTSEARLRRQLREEHARGQRR